MVDSDLARRRADPDPCTGGREGLAQITEQRGVEPCPGGSGEDTPLVSHAPALLSQRVYKAGCFSCYSRSQNGSHVQKGLLWVDAWSWRGVEACSSSQP